MVCVNPNWLLKSTGNLSRFEYPDFFYRDVSRRY
jgi:hypothetical protein